MKPLRVLIVEDSDDDEALLLLHLSRSGYDVMHERVQSAQAMRQTLADFEFDVIISDFQMPNFTGLEAYLILKESNLDIPFIIISGTIGEEVAVQAMVMGVSDYMMKDNLTRLVPAVEREINEAANRRLKREAEIAQRKSEERYRDLFENANDTIYTNDLDGNFTSVNKKGEELTGYTRDEILHSNFRDLLSEEDALKVREMVRGKLSGITETMRYELEIIGKGNIHKYVEISSRVIYDDYGQAVGIQGIARDITERKRLEDDLRESEQRLQLALSAAEMGVWEWNLKNNSVFWSPECHKILKADNFGGQLNDFESMIHPGDYVNSIEVARRAIENHTIYDSEFRVKVPTGETLWVTNRALTEYGADNIPQRMIGTVADITERKTVEEELRESQARLQLAQESARIGTWEWNLLTGEIVWSEMIWNLYNLSPQDFKPDYQSWQKLINQDDLVVVEEQLKKALDGYDLVDLEFRTIKPSKQPIWIASKGRVIRDAEGKAVRLVGINIDITERKRAEEELNKSEEKLRQSQKLESIGRLAGGIAHDFNNMLTVINGYSDLSLRRFSAEDPIRVFIEEVRKAGERSAELTNQLLAFSRRQILQPKILNINQIISDTTVMLQRLIGEDIQIISALHSDIWQIQADPGQMSQVLMNLVVNSRDAMPTGGTVTIETENITLDDDYVQKNAEAKAGDYVLLAVSDTGVGIDADEIQNIFEPFYTTKEIGKGTGLGLATVYGIIKQSNGFLSVSSTPGIGTTFEIFLPRTEAETVINTAGNGFRNTLNGTKTILLVEDEHMVRNLSRRILESYGYQVVEAKNGEEALKISSRSDTDFALLLTDIVMPKVGGYELAEKMQKQNPKIKILFTSGYTEDERIQNSNFRTTKNFIHKPFEPEALVFKIRELLDEDETS